MKTPCGFKKIKMWGTIFFRQRKMIQAKDVQKNWARQNVSRFIIPGAFFVIDFIKSK